MRYRDVFEENKTHEKKRMKRTGIREKRRLLLEEDSKADLDSRSVMMMMMTLLLKKRKDNHHHSQSRSHPIRFLLFSLNTFSYVFLSLYFFTVLLFRRKISLSLSPSVSVQYLLFNILLLPPVFEGGSFFLIPFLHDCE